MVDLVGKVYVYMVSNTIRAEDNRIIPCICIKNEPGYYLTDYRWSTDIANAQKSADRMNKMLGHTPEEAALIIASTMKTRFIREGRLFQ